MPIPLLPMVRSDRTANRADNEMLGLIEALDWSATPLGSRRDWSREIILTLRMMLTSPVPMALLVGPEATLIYNNGYIPICGRKHPACLGQAIFDVWPEAADFNRTMHALVMEGQTVSYEDQSFTLLRNEAPEHVWFDLDYSPIIDDTGRAIAVLAIVAETTKRVTAEQELIRSQERLSLALGASAIVGTWDWNVEDDRVYADARLSELFGLTPEEGQAGVAVERYLAGIHPEDAPRVLASLYASIEKRAPFREEYRMARRRDGTRWVLAEGRPAFDEDGNCRRFPGVAVDITAQKRAIEAHTRSETAFRTLADAMPQMVWSTRPDGHHDYYNARWYEFTGVPDGSTDGEGWNGMFHEEDQERAWAQWRHCLATGEPYQIEYRLRHNSGHYRWVLGRALPIRDSKGRITRWYGTCTDIHDARMAAVEREIVAHELSHRIKNIFSVLSGIIGLQARTMPEARSFAEQLRQRIEAMGRAHDFVRPHSRTSRPAPIETTLFALLDQLLQPFGGSDRPGTQFDGDDVAIGDSAATPLALLLHELATNAAKYGALSVETGRLTITGKADGERYSLEWRETDGPEIYSAPEREGFGSRLIRISVEGQLGGTIERYWEREGMRVVVSVPQSSLSRMNQLKAAAAQ